MSISPLDADRTAAVVPARPGRTRRRTTVVSAVTFSLLAGAGLGAMTLTSGAEEATATPTTSAATTIELAASSPLVDGPATTSAEPATATATTEAPSTPFSSATTAATTKPAPATTAKPASPTTKAPTTSTTARIPATSKVVSFRGDGFGPVNLGQDFASAHAALVKAYGSPTWEDEQWWTDGDRGEIRAASWGALHVTFRGVGGNRAVAGAYYYALDTVVAGPELTTTHGLGTTDGLSLRYDETFGDGRPTVADPRHDSAVCVADGSGSVCAYFPNDVTEDGTYVHRPESLAWTVIVGDVDAPHGC